MDASSSTSSSSSSITWKKTKVLLVGPMTTLANCVAEASLESGYKTAILLDPPYPSRDVTINEMIANLLANRLFSLSSGRIEKQNKLVQAMSDADVIVATAGGDEIEKHLSAIIEAMLEIRNFQRLIPLGILMDVDQITDLQPGNAGIEMCRSMRRRIEESGVRYTYVVTNFLGDQFFGRINNDIEPLSVPLKKRFYGDGTTKVCFSFERDAARYIVKAAVDLKMVYKTLYIRHPENVLSLNDIVSMWARKIEGPCERPPHVLENELLSSYRGATDPNTKTELAYMHSAFIMGDQTKFSVDPELGVEACQMYRDIEFTKVEDHLNYFLPD